MSDSVRWLRAEDAAVALFAYLAAPVWIGVGVASLLSPALIVERHAADWHWGWSLGTGIGWSGDTLPWRFSRLRLQVEYATARTGQVSSTLLADWNARAVLMAPLFRLGGSLGLGIEHSGAGSFPYVQAELWLRNAMGIWYLGLFPQHSLGFRLRSHLSNFPSRWQLALGYWSTFVW